MRKRIITSKRLKRSLVIIILLVIGLLSFTFAITSNKTYKINLNDGLPVIDVSTQKIVPGTTIEREFFIENKSSNPIDYKLYFENIEGQLGSAITATFYDGDKVILSGIITQITKAKISKATGTLNANEKKYLKVVFTFPEEISNEYKDSALWFDIKAVALWRS